MRRLSLAALVAAAVASVSCSSPTAATTTTTTTPATYTDTFSGTLTKNGASSYAFSVAAAGTVYATLTSVADSTVLVGLSLGTMTSTGTCTIVLSNDAAVQGTSIYGSATGLGTLCARVYDVGKVSGSLDYQISVTHP
jgi:hypothetical protein